jgi:rubrerythrin
MVTVKDVILQAMATEQAAYEFYRKCADSTKQQTLKALFSRLASEELKHKDLFSKIDPESSDAVSASINWFSVIDSLWTYNSENTKNIRNIFEFAMDRELKEGEYYKRLSEALAEPKVKKLCASLSIIESGHYNLLKSEFERFVGKDG